MQGKMHALSGKRLRAVARVAGVLSHLRMPLQVARLVQWFRWRHRRSQVEVRSFFKLHISHPITVSDVR
jgi:hypothetical protein